MKTKALFSALIGVVVGCAVFLAWNHPTGLRPDLWQPWFGARSILHGIDPYPIVGPGRQYVHEFRFLYPLTASVIILPLGLLPIAAAAGVFSGLSAALLAYALPVECWAVFVSVPFITAAWAGQWSPLLTACFFFPVLSWLNAGKPSIGASVFLSKPSRWGFVGGLAVLLVSLAFVPRWPLEWLESVGTAGHMTPVLARPGGWVALAGLYWWRKPEGRLIVLLALVPQTNLWYEALPLFAIPKTMRESLLLTVTTSAPLIYEVLWNHGGDLWPKDYQLALFAYLPAILILALRQASSQSAPVLVASEGRNILI